MGTASRLRWSQWVSLHAPVNQRTPIVSSLASQRTWIDPRTRHVARRTSRSAATNSSDVTRQLTFQCAWGNKIAVNTRSVLMNAQFHHFWHKPCGWAPRVEPWLRTEPTCPDPESATERFHTLCTWYILQNPSKSFSRGSRIGVWRMLGERGRAPTMKKENILPCGEIHFEGIVSWGSGACRQTLGSSQPNTAHSNEI